ncbi:MAG: M15 family metallopeptidase, partial [Sphingomonadaceae bacterium]|nr:M15 family metallopeptidase [Sphingomonadaceae bacterium]
ATALLACSQPTPAAADEPRGQADSAAEAMSAAYPEAIADFENGELIFADGTRMAVSDGIEGKSEAAILDSPDIDDMFAWPYPSGEPAPATRDPGRARHEPLFRRLYGDCRSGGAAALDLRDVAWMPSLRGGTLPMSTRHGAADALEAVVRELEALPPGMTRFLVPSAGSFNCRPIAGTDRLSAHGLGIALDIATAQSDYWRWAGGEGARWRNRIPYEIVEIFERHGFIWGGRWRHFDTMHFEYRPELLVGRRGDAR